MRLERWRQVAEVVALLGAPDERLEGTCVRLTGAAEWRAVVEVAGRVYRVHVARYARRDYSWSWEVSQGGVRVRGGEERTIAELRAWVGESIGDLFDLPSMVRTRGARKR